MEARLSEVGVREVAPCVLSPAPAATPSFVATVGWLDSGVPLVSVSGELDLASAPALEESLFGLCDAPAGAVIVDLEKCSFIDLRGLRVLLTAQEQLERSKQPLVLVVGKPTLLRVFQVTRVDVLFHICPTLGEAIDGYGHP